MPRGDDDLRRAADALAVRLPEPLAPLAQIAFNYRWSWLPGGHKLFSTIAPHRWARAGSNPVRLLQEVSAHALDEAAGNEDLLAQLQAAREAIDADLGRPPLDGPASPERPVAFFCAEFGVHRSLPIYSGGLGALAGDILKESSDRALPLVAIGLMYHQGYFRQRIDASGWQQEYWEQTDPDRLPAALVRGEDGAPLTVTVPINGEDVVAQIWRLDIGRVPLYLLDADRPENSHVARWTSAQLYTGDPFTRLSQYLLLGVGGMRALRAMDIEPGVVHLNEGHAAFAQLELGDPDRTVFTTHTPVPAGNDTYPADDVRHALQGFEGVDVEDVIRLGRTHPDDEHEPFGVTQYALRTSRAANAVAARHGEVAREMWHELWPDRPVDEVPITHVTNGVHVPTWVGGPMRRLLDRHLGGDWMARTSDPATWAPVEQIPDEDLWAARAEQRAALVDFVRERSAMDRLSRGEHRDYVEAAARAFDPGVLTVGFARRLATYKRLTLLISDPGRALNLLRGDRPIQIVIAGKAHPRDDAGKSLIQALFGQRGAPEVGERVIFLHDYNLSMGARLTQGCDVWLNVPRPPLEASGTSGMKSAMNGGLNLSVLDGWWPEAYDGTNGWAISGEVDDDHGAQDARDASELYRLLEEEVVPAFYGRDDHGLPLDWLARVKRSLMTVGPGFAASRMVGDYIERMYAPVATTAVR